MRSGLRCVFEPGARPNRIIIYDDGPERGNDVGCNTAKSEVVTSAYVILRPKLDSIKDQFQEMVAGVKSLFPDAAPYKGPFANADFQFTTRGVKAPKVLRARLAITVDGKRQLTKIQAAKVSVWTVELRATGPIDSTMSVDVVSEIVFVHAMLDVFMQDYAARSR